MIKAKSGDNSAIQILLKQYQNLLKGVSRQHHLLSIQEEAYEEAIICFYQAIMDFDEALGIPFAGFAKVRVYQGVHSLFRKYLRIWQNEVSLSAKIDEDDEYLDLITDNKDFWGNVIFNLDLQRIIMNLPYRQYQVFILVALKGLKYQEVGIILQISEQAVSKHYRKAIAFINKSLKTGEK